MLFVELGLLVLAYTMLILTLFVGLVCYKRNLEALETIALTGALLLLVVAMSSYPIMELMATGQETNVFVQLVMVLVGITTALNVLQERQHTLPGSVKKWLFGLAGAMALLVLVAALLGQLAPIQYVVAGYMGLSIVASMIFVQRTKPHPRIAHREKTERLFAILFMVLVPLSLVVGYVFEFDDDGLTIGYTIPVVFILLAASKLTDDLQRLSLFKLGGAVNEQHFKNYALTAREQEIALLLAEGRTYKAISEALFISMPTVKTHASSIYRKCGVKNRSELAKLLSS